MSLKERILADVKVAMRERDKARLGTLRLITAEIKQREVDGRSELGDEQIVASLERMIKQRRESIVHYERGNRPDLVAQEQAEIEVIQIYLPEPLSPSAIDALIEEALRTTEATSIRDMGKVMAWLKPHTQGRADMGAIGAAVKAHLSKPS